VFLKYFDHGKNARGLAGVGETQHRTFELDCVGPGRAKFIQVREKDVRRLKADLISSFRGAPPCTTGVRTTWTGTGGATERPCRRLASQATIYLGLSLDVLSG